MCSSITQIDKLNNMFYLESEKAFGFCLISCNMYIPFIAGLAELHGIHVDVCYVRVWFGVFAIFLHYKLKHCKW